jgi:6-phosphogluconolactonase
MSKFELISFSGESELATAAAAACVREIATAARNPAPFLVALSGGRIVRRFFAAVTDLAKAQGVSMNTVHLFWSDERCVPPNDPESNFAAARELLLAPLAVPEAQIHRLRGEDPPDLAAAGAEKDLRRLAPGSADGQPIFDLVFLGLGEDGHVASLFPGEPASDSANPAVYRPVTAAKPPPRRITLGYPAIAAARQVWVLASGAGKEGALRNSLAPNGATPFARVLKLRSLTRIFTDIPLPKP